MNIGEFNKRITLQYQAKAADGMGGFTVTWTDSADVWAAIWPVSASEIVKGDKSGLEVTHRIRIWYRPGISSSWRIQRGGRYFNIISVVNPSENNRMLDLICKEVVA